MFAAKQGRIKSDWGRGGETVRVFKRLQQRSGSHMNLNVTFICSPWISSNPNMHLKYGTWRFKGGSSWSEQTNSKLHFFIVVGVNQTPNSHQLTSGVHFSKERGAKLREGWSCVRFMCSYSNHSQTKNLSWRHDYTLARWKTWCCICCSVRICSSFNLNSKFQVPVVPFGSSQAFQTFVFPVWPYFNLRWANIPAAGFSFVMSKLLRGYGHSGSRRLLPCWLSWCFKI